MSRVYVLASDRQLPPQDSQQPRAKVCKGVSVTTPGGFKVEPLDYYRQAVEDLGYPMKPYRYEFELEKEETDLQNLRSYLEEHFSPGETLELWSVWVGDVKPKCPPRFQGRLADFDRETLEQFLSAKEICFTITME